MFELGSSLRETRIRRGLELAQVATETRIRTRYLEALEEERFDRLPGSVYARGFVRSYAAYLGLDAQLFLEEYDARFKTRDEPLPAPAQLELRPRSPRPYVLAAIALLLALLSAVLAWQLSSSSSPRPGRPQVTPVAAAPAPPPATPPQPAPPAGRTGTAAAAALVLRATRGPCWLSVRDSGEQGRQLFEGMLAPGESRRFGERRLWLRIGAPWNLLASRGGRSLSLPPGVANVLVTSSGIRTLALG